MNWTDINESAPVFDLRPSSSSA